MNLTEMLGYADIQQLTRIARSYHCECSANSKNELIQSILTALSRKEVFEGQMAEMSIEDRRFLNSLIFDKRSFFSMEELTARVMQSRFPDKEETIAAASPRDLIQKFKQKGWLFNGYSHQTKYLFSIPEDLKRRLLDVMSRAMQAHLVLAEEPPAYRDEQQVLAEDIHKFLHYIRANQIPLTSDGTMYKRSVQQLLELMQVREEPVVRGGWRFGYGRKFKEYPNRFSFIYDYCYFQGLIQELSDQLVLTPDGEARLAQGYKDKPNELYHFWLRLYKGPVLHLQAMVHWVDRLCKDWVTFRSLQAVLLDYIRPFYYDTPESIFEQRIIQMLMHLGLLQVGESSDGELVIRMNRIGSKVIAGVDVKDEETIPVEIDSAAFS